MDKVKILVVEDNRIVAEDIKNNLVEIGYSVSAIATSGKRALEAAATEIPDIAIMDIRLGQGMNGIDTATELRRNYQIPIIYLTAHADAETVAKAKKTEPYAYLVKPFDVEELQSAVEIAIYRHKMELKLRESEQWLFTTLKSIGDGVIATDWDGRIKFMNEMAEKMTGWPQAEAVGKPLPEVFHIINENSREIVEDPSAKVIATGQIVGLANHTLLIRRDGSEIPIKDSGAPIVLDSGNSIGVVLVFQDDSDSRAAEKRLRESKERLSLAMESANEGLWEWNSSENEMTFDPLCFKLLGYAEDIAVGDHRRWWKQRIHPDDADRVEIYMIEILNGNGAVTGIDYRIYGAKGESIWVTSRAKVIQRGDDGEPQVVVGILRNIDDRKLVEKEKEQLELKLRQSQKVEAIGTLAGGIAHDFNNILASVIGYTELALDETEQDSILHQNLNEIMVAGLRARDLVRQILVFSRHTDTQQKQVMLNDLVKEAINLMRATIPTSIAIQDTFTSNPLHIRANASQIHQVILNLCTNAFHALEQEENGTLSVMLEKVCFEDHVKLPFADIRAGRYACISVIDNGHGIDTDCLQKIFDPYFTTKDQEKGTGLGLSIVNGIVSQHNGYILVDSSPGDGSTFRVYLPLVNDAAVELELSPLHQMPQGKGERILLVDDEAAIAKMQKQNLERLGYVVDISTDSREALERFLEDPSRYDLLITDMTMPQMTGDKLVRRIREVAPDLPVILCSGFSEKINPDRCDELNINCFMMKPVQKSKIAVAIRDVLSPTTIPE